MKRSWVGVSSVVLPLNLYVLVAGLAGCQSEADGPDEQEELLALLRDDPLTNIPAGPSVTTRAASTGPQAGEGVAALATDPPIGRWTFNDCSDFQTQLFDSSGNENTAFRAVAVACTEGISSQGVAIAAREDIVYVPDQPTFTFESGVTVAGWFRPTVAGGTRTLFRKRDRDTSSFALLINDRKFQFVASLGDGRAISVASPANVRANQFQHVAGTYDGQTLRLYVDGVEVNTFSVAGTIPVGPGPLLMGNDGSERRLLGAIDEAVFATHALDADEILALTCLPQTPTLVFSPNFIEEAPGVPATVDVSVTNNNPALCAPISFSLVTIDDGFPIALDPPPFEAVDSGPVASGETVHFTITATATEEATPGDLMFFEFFVQEPTTDFFEFGFVEFLVAESSGVCSVNTSRELMIRNVSVVDDPVRTVFDPSSSDPRNGVWTFKHLMESMAPSPEQAPAMVEAMLTTFTVDTTINGFSVASRPGVQPSILNAWPRTTDGALDLAQAPLRLQAIVNRFDLRDLAAGDAGEGRFVFAFEQDGFPLEATLILEYKLPASSEADVLGWASAFHALGALQFGEEYNDALQLITEGFAGQGARPGSPNGSAINAVRTNEIAFGGVWELREFTLSPATGLLEPATVKLTPDLSFNRSQALVDYVVANLEPILIEKHVVPDILDGQAFQGGAIFNDLTTWFAPGVDPEARHLFALNTCNGCHSLDETGTSFLHISPRFPGDQASLSGFLTGTTISDPETGDTRTFNDLGRRNADLRAIVCTDPSARSGAFRASLRKGIDRVH